ncbi:RTC4-like domain-containing protein [Schizophyllum amplum]|uniref:Restriction of telomere capping protein 4 n=1 Tax=Schizophyllum amplum TaxID=97359 RepID=A0A550CKU5_9AGAR|nr:RTC4-like domain-containing protein [Auriculariopsis ampla]
MNRLPSLSRIDDKSHSDVFKMSSRTVINGDAGKRRGEGRDGCEDLAMPKPNPSKKPPSVQRRDLFALSDSDDELTHPFGADISANRIQRSPSRSQASKPARADVDPARQQKQINIYKTLSFKKMSKSSDATAESRASTSKAPVEQIDLTKPDSTSKRPSSPSRLPLKHQSVNARRSPPRQQRVPSPPPPITSKPSRNLFAKSKTASKGQPAAPPTSNPFGKKKPQPKPVRRAQRQSPSPPPQAEPIEIDDDDGGDSDNDEEEEQMSRKKPVRKRNSNRITSPEPAPFPMPLTPRKKPRAQAFPMSNDSPLSSPPRRGPDAFPMQSPLSSQTRPVEEEEGSNEAACPSTVKTRLSLDKGKGKAVQLPPKNKAKPVRKPQPPPFSQFVPSLFDSPTSGNKRFSDDGLSEGERNAKRPRSESPTSTYELMDDDDPDLQLGQASADARDLCPYCDELLPPSPTPILQRLLDEVAKKSRPAPRPANARGRKAQLRHFAPVCQRHRFEREVLPEAESKGWPKKIDWGALPARVRRFSDELHGLLDDELDHAGCIFWKELAQEIKEKGSRAATGVSAQFENFEKVQIGYYGEQGAAIITQTLYSMFPMDIIDPDKVAPIGPGEFLQRVLLPEAGLRLIEEDRGLGQADALRTLRESAKYGVAMFPDDAGVAGGKASVAPEWQTGCQGARGPPATANRGGRARGGEAGRCGNSRAPSAEAQADT